MGKLNVSVLRYLTREDFRVLTAVSVKVIRMVTLSVSMMAMCYELI